jgi:hypothetical protein
MQGTIHLAHVLRTQSLPAAPVVKKVITTCACASHLPMALRFGVAGARFELAALLLCFCCVDGWKGFGERAEAGFIVVGRGYNGGIVW